MSPGHQTLSQSPITFQQLDTMIKKSLKANLIFSWCDIKQSEIVCAVNKDEFYDLLQIFAANNQCHENICQVMAVFFAILLSLCIHQVKAKFYLYLA